MNPTDLESALQSISENSTRLEVSQAATKFRTIGDLASAIKICERAILLSLDNKFFYKILSDLHFQNDEFDQAFIALARHLQLISTYHREVNGFAKRYHRFRRSISQEKALELTDMVFSTINEKNFKPAVATAVKAIISSDIHVVSEETDQQSRLFLELLKDDSQFESFVKLEKRIEEDSSENLSAILDAHILNRKRTLKTFRIDLYCVSLYEKLGSLASALKIITELLAVKVQPIAVRSLFRICRLRKDYGPADILLEREPALLRARDFNVLYEMVYYFEAKNDYHTVQSILRTIDKGFATNLPVLRTVRNFYIRFGMLEEAKRLEHTISFLYQKRENSDQKYIAEVAESETELASKVQDLYSQLEHQKQLAAISDLTTGISHELGQPITNIRYTIQFYQKLFEKKLTLSAVSTVFASILEETERMGGLIRRLSPLTSSRGVIESFDIMERIRRRADGESPRLIQNNISVKISPKGAITLVGDPVKFDQLISNLLLNSIDAISERKISRENIVDIRVESNPKEVTVYFSDSGVGIPMSNRNKIFDPFFSTKAPGQGEGLGLFIVWNLLKMLGGKISVDVHYNQGARFLITLPKQPSNSEVETA
ncbi:sensor histidine kinase [Pseudomonas capsici]|uniref:histidine kinase n=1 Tax=Pseudomonas capsici TaxID=2810614 RepID=A0ABT3C3K8_9PSED|nr:HAMP domain-containing sensor histidine kinase [Pseudomonas capsici]MBN6715504.1 HAMP domain-containing histidine kinase [Pseudomonas capsici]MBN6720413.1 HAMP domain-containing histidine kinase [Pseudomonas capsici]MBN6725377.1 HAMP domain-containing histidine kinase [Pseudomonas capsici]MCV4270711.1 HAMP domain-containing histidine kinase [Pseudomonas capsici]MCV4280905.1 HAMP domain-containing histidine kinase [Pseudomonas capsici]